MYMALHAPKKESSKGATRALIEELVKRGNEETTALDSRAWGKSHYTQVRWRVLRRTIRFTLSVRVIIPGAGGGDLCYRVRAWANFLRGDARVHARLLVGFSLRSVCDAKESNRLSAH